MPLRSPPVLDRFLLRTLRGGGEWLLQTPRPPIPASTWSGTPIVPRGSPQLQPATLRTCCASPPPMTSRYAIFSQLRRHSSQLAIDRRPTVRASGFAEQDTLNGSTPCPEFASMLRSQSRVRNSLKPRSSAILVSL